MKGSTEDILKAGETTGSAQQEQDHPLASYEEPKCYGNRQTLVLYRGRVLIKGRASRRTWEETMPLSDLGTNVVRSEGFQGKLWVGLKSGAILGAGVFLIANILKVPL
jgi:hypothetical protein